MDDSGLTKLYTCGDSFMTLDYPSDGIISFTELYARQRGFDHVNLARPGATNFAIRLQIDVAINQQADYVVIGVTSSDRFDVPTTDIEGRYLVLDNIDYSNYRAKSQLYVDSSQACIASDTFNNLIEGSRVSDSKKQALKNYIADLHDRTIQSQKDYYMICDGLRRLEQHNIPFLLIPTWMNQFKWNWVKKVWPAHIPGPYDMPYYTHGNPVIKNIYTGTHNPAKAHEEFCRVLIELTNDWH